MLPNTPGALRLPAALLLLCLLLAFPLYLGATVAPLAQPLSAGLADADADGLEDELDNCPYTYNPGQEDADEDGGGDACDEDMDGDGTNNPQDNCPADDNPNQADYDGDGTGDVCDQTPFGPDGDGDGVPDSVDNCPNTPNPEQYDQDFDRAGDACDGDIDGDGYANEQDCDPRHAGIHPGADEIQGDGLDNDCNGLTDDEEALAEPQFHISTSDNVITISSPNSYLLRPGQEAVMTISVTSLDPQETLQLRITQVYDHYYNEVALFEGATLTPALPMSGTGSLTTELRWTPSWEQAGLQEMHLEATDGSGSVALHSLYFYVGEQPQIQAPPAVTVPVNTWLEFNIPVTGGFGTVWPAGRGAEALGLMGFEANTGILIIGEIAPEHMGTHAIELLAWDETGLMVSKTMLITVVAECSLQSWYPDSDGDGWGIDNPYYRFTSCSPIEGYVANQQDCNDSNAGIHPQAQELPADGLDNNCNGELDEEEEPTTCPAAQALKLEALCPEAAAQHRWRVYNPNPCAVPVRWEVHKTAHTGTMIAQPGENYLTTPAGSKNNTVLFLNWQDAQGKWKKKGMASAAAHCGKQPNNSGKGDNSRLATAAEGLELYPVPFRQQLRVVHQSITPNVPARVALIGLEGRTLEVSAQIVEQGQGYLQLSLQTLPLSGGLYILRLEVAGQPPVFKRVLRQE